ncbi:hypothetical protein LCGC14_2549540 [marine sediment metagenome]|uniref:Glutaredoxin domain-containing protein n=1 Tax=marine sediment metagenome TaxID=412755 RepID=A0A0F9CZK8_9ZZZZ
MSDVTVYSTRLCPYCFQARRLLRRHGVEWEEHRLSRRSRERLAELSQGGRTFPQVLIDGRSVGGFAELRGLDRDGTLRQMLGRA